MKSKINNCQDEKLIQISTAIISVFLHISRTSKIEKKHIEAIANLLSVAFGYETSLQFLWEVVNHPYSLRQASAIFNRYLKKSDKIKLFLNIFYLVYMENIFQVLSSLEIIKIVDLLYLDVRLYEQMLDIIENKSNYFSVNLNDFIEDRPSRVLFNDMIFNDNSQYDVKINNSNLIVLNILNQTFIGSQTNDWCLNLTKTDQNTFYLINDNDVLKLDTKVTDIEKPLEILLKKVDLLKLWQRNKTKFKSKYLITLKNVDLSIEIDEYKTFLKLLNGLCFLNNFKLRGRKELAVNDILSFNNVEKDYYTGWEFIIANRSSSKEIVKFDEIFVIQDKGILQTTFKKSQPCCARIIFNREDNSCIFINEHNFDIKLNNKSINGKEVITINDLVGYNGINYIFDKHLKLRRINSEINEFKVNEIYHEFKRGNKVALNNIHFTLTSKEMLAIMGPSGSGKTTFLKCLLGEIIPKRCDLSIDGKYFSPSKSEFSKNIAYVPQDDLLFENLTIMQNLYYSAKVRMINLDLKDNILLDEKIKHILTLVGLWDKKNTIVGNADKKYLSGGERKRLNVALELLLDPTIIVLDEPTSGLSSKDSEKLIEILDELKLQGKIIIATIHQPNADLFQRFDKLLLLDRGGIQVYFGSTKDIFSYFDDELEKITQYDEQVSSKEISSVVMLMQKKKFLMPEYIFDLLEYSHYSGLSGFTERFFTPLYWKEKYRKNQLYEIFHYQNAHEYDYNSSDKTEIIKERFEFIKCLFRVHYMFLRNMINKLSNRTNIIITFIASPLLALVIAFILRYADIENTSDYSFYHNPNVVLFMFISVIVFIFLGMANSINEIIPERRILSREKKINVKDYEFLIVKFVLLCIISAIQASLFLLVSMPIIKINGMFIYYFIYLFLSAVSGNSIGLLLSGALNDRESVTNLLPYLLIPQILFAGAVIPFAEMNNYIKICEKAAVPEFCNIIPSRWLFEGIAVSQASNNYYDLKLNKIYDDIKKTDDSSQKTKYYRELNNFLKKSNKEDYINLKLMNWVNMQNGRAYNTNKYQFMSTNRYIKSKTIPVSSFNVYIIVFFNMILGVLTLIALKRKKEN